ncbi:FAD-binding protein [Bifidobacterium vansinderenii]|uniref:succinate dehydrogenase n=1 Tax=Bifidobacterium vansinderenii TaxID=1984871 RepID=A0A229VXW5_9BIFI|nr:FAD-binding protein [Bifidobacterium vansinderenii]OXN00463.1 succinate dehydrogenase [Bifidobacterium vansinderenii]
MSPKQLETQYDVVIVGAGAAGLSASLGLVRSDRFAQMKEEGRTPRILVISKLQPLRSHTGSAEGGIAASLGSIDHDDWHWHFYDTIKGSDWLADQDMAEILAKEAPATVIGLEHDGVAFSRTEDGHIAQRLFGGHTAEFGKQPVRRTAYAADRIGHQILHALWQQCVKEGVEFAEEWYVSDLVVERDGNGHTTARGLVVIDTHSGKVHGVNARNIVLATGGAGRLFHTTSNSWDLTGDGMALALEAGLQLEDTEFVQFHPTGLAHTGILLSEAARGEGGRLLNADGEHFMDRYAPGHGDLAARDVVSRSIVAEVDAGRGVADPKDPNGPKDCVWLDLTGIGEQTLKEKLPEVCDTVREYAGLDPAHDLIPIKPTAHYTMGGIPITADGNVYEWVDGSRRIVDGLYAAGECSCVSVHGANRLGANSLLDACLFGSRTGAAIANAIADDPMAGVPDEELIDVDSTAVDDAADNRERGIKALLQPANADADDNDSDADNADDANGGAQTDDNPYRLMADLGALMERHAAVRCDHDGIATALATIDDTLAPRAERLHAHSDTAAYNQELTAILEARHLVTLATVMLAASDAREESRGSLYRTDHPQRDDERFLAHSMVTRDRGVAWQPVTITAYPPKARQY